MFTKIKFFLWEIKQSSVIFLIFILAYPIIAMLFFAFLKTAFRNSGVMCQADFINCIGNDTLMLMILIPIGMWINFAVSKKNLTINYILRHKSKQKVLAKQNNKIIFTSVLLSIYVAISSCFVARLFSPVELNWDKSTSFYFAVNKEVLNTNFFEVVFCSAVCLVLTMIFYSLLLKAINIFLKDIFSFIITIMIFAFGIVERLAGAICSMSGANRDGIYSYSYTLVFGAVLIVLIGLIMCFAMSFSDKKDYINV